MIRRIALRAQGKYERAAPHFQESLVVARTIERDSYRVYAEIRSLVDLARTESEQGASEQAIKRFKDALAVGRRRPAKRESTHG